MARRQRLNAALAHLAEVRLDPTSSESLARLRSALSNGSNFVAGRAATIVGELEIHALAPDLAAAFDRFLGDPVAADPGCKAKAAAAGALRRLGRDDGDVFLWGIRHVQMEPVFGGREDTAVELRGECALGLAETGHPQALVELAALLADREAPARMAAARALGCAGRGDAVPLLRFKALLGDDDPRVVGECFSSLLYLDPIPSAAFAAGFLTGPRDELAEAAALALGESALPEALDALVQWWRSSPPPRLRHTCLIALALLRRPEAFDLLFEVMAEAPLRDALGAVEALATYRHDQAVAERARQTAERRSAPELSAATGRVFQVEAG